ncbi:glutamine-rich protein 2 [Mus pahari]|uniref:glutamine-rich protein 2 n=1 Tax=Mus pahari TaxID=10093 RepID=UPI001114B78A|nr:glutamine-rich protein 2 [Mus pahari]
MPPSLVANRVSLRELADLAIGTPEVGAVNFTALHTLIVSILKSLNLQEVLIDFHYPSAETGRGAESLHGTHSAPHLSTSKEKHRSLPRLSQTPQELENQVKDLGSQVQDLTKQFKTMDNKVQGMATQIDQISVPELQQQEEEMALVTQQISLTKFSKIYESEEMMEKPEPPVKMPTQMVQLKPSRTPSLTKSTSVLQDLIEDVKILKQAPELQPGTDQHLVPPGVGQPSLIQPGAFPLSLAQLGADQQGLIQTDTGQPVWVQPSTDQGGWVQPGAYLPGRVHPSVDQRGLVQVGMDQQELKQPGAVQHGLVQPGAYAPGLMQVGTSQDGLFQPGMDQLLPGMVQPDGVQPGVLQPGGVQPGVLQPDRIQSGVLQPGAAQPGMVQPGAAQPGLVTPGATQPGLVQPGAAQPGMVTPGATQPGLVQPGAAQPGMVQPGAAQPGMVQPVPVQLGMVLPVPVQPGVLQAGAVQPGVLQAGAVQPGVLQAGAVQPGVLQAGAVQPGVLQAGAVQPGVLQAGAVQPGMVQPGAVQPGVLQPGAVQRGLVQPDESGLAQGGMAQQGVAQPGKARQGVAQPGKARQGVAHPGLAQPGAPSADKFGLAQPIVDQSDFMQPGMDKRGLVQPRMYQYGFVEPSDLQRDFLQPKGVPPRLEHPAVDQGSLLQAGLAQPRMVQPITDQRGLVQPITDQRGQVQPGTLQPRQVQPGTMQRGLVQTLLGQYGLMQPVQKAKKKSVEVQYDTEEAGLPEQVQRVEADTQVSWELDSAAQTAPEQVIIDSRTQESWNYLQQFSSESLAPNFPMAVETFRLIGELISLYLGLKEQLKDLDEDLAGQTEFEKIQYLISMIVKKTISQDLAEQLKSLKMLNKEVRQDKAKLEKIQKFLDSAADTTGGKEVKPNHLSLQLGILRVTVSDIEKELNELRESQDRGKATMENSVSEASLYLQDQLDKLRTIIESMLSSSSTLLSMSITPHKSTAGLVPGQIDPEATCPACSLDVSHQVSLLVQRYEQLQDMVSGLAASRPSKKAKLQGQDEELLGHVQSAILQVQGDCEKLNITTSNLIEDHRQKQKDIEVLYQGIERLDKEKANREHLEMEIDEKADKSALASKVSRIQFDATTEQLNHMMQELVAKMSGQEQDWQKLLDKLLAEMDSKLDRLELDPLKQMLEDRWKSLRQQLKERSPLYQADEAAAMRRQLLAHFHCLSCDRPLETTVTGQVISMTPIISSMPGHRSVRPYTVFELEQIRQQSRSLKLGSSFPRGDVSQMERSVGRLHSMHSKMLMDIEKVQIHFGGSVKASSQMIRELLHTQCLSHPCYKRGADTADYTYSTVPRRCGGSHTLTYPYRRNRPQHLSPLEEIQIAMKHDEVDILGLDGHIYKGRMDTRLPGILGKDAPGVAKHNKAKLQQLQQLQQLQELQQLQQAQQAQHARPHVHRQPSMGNMSSPPSRPQSAQMLADSNAVPSGQKKDRPVSSEGRLLQSNLSHSSIPTDMASLQGSQSGLNMHIDVPPGEGLEEPTRGPRSTTAH